MLTEDDIIAAQPRHKPYKISDSGGLYVFVTPTGTKSFRLKYRFGGVEKRLTFGLFPRVSLDEARRLRQRARWTLKTGCDPALGDPALDPGTLDRIDQIAASAIRPTSVYFLRGDAGLIKIGVARNVAKRMVSLQCDQREQLQLLGSMAGSYSLEMILHRLFAEDRVNGEWFRPSQRLLDFIEDNAVDGDL